MSTQPATNKKSDQFSERIAKVQVPLRVHPKQKTELEATAKKESRSISSIALRRYELGCEAEKQQQLV